jgi:hypothetical protein
LELDADKAGQAEVELHQLQQYGFPKKGMDLCFDPEGKWRSTTYRRFIWERFFAPSFPALAVVAGVLLKQHATSCSTERSWSVARNVFRPNRSRLDLLRGEKVMFIANAWGRENGGTQQQQEDEVPWWVGVEEDSESEDVSS